MEVDRKQPQHGAAEDIEAHHAQLLPEEVLGADISTVGDMVRQGFIRKVFAILCTQLMVTFGVVAPFLYASARVHAQRWSSSSPALSVCRSRFALTAHTPSLAGQEPAALRAD